MSEKDDVEQRLILAQFRVAAAREMVAGAPSDPQALRELERVTAELEAAMAEWAKESRQG